MSSSALFQEERLGVDLCPGGSTCKSSNGDGLSNFLGLKFGQILFFLGGVENWRYFFRLHKAMTTAALFHPRLQCNFQKLLCCHRE